ncbi:2-phospho-L-lactate transferase [Halomonas icarae]|uniref:2-phospho-L-lactate transferase n=1 Tax=Halomonas icarae TaxID=2691040 RepID=A0A7X4W029_9GAMM|nr:2-phospho-L-lactate transferase [Halomonas icarae]MDR5903544.1 2-phospho-L-lactate transferase [Halomonas icarae]NAW13362.1 2-phospho-L-lactate transferase [Halomonas icarae]
MTLRITLLAGGVGGAKLAEGLASLCPHDTLSIIGNVGDDQEFHGLWVSPDIDTLTYSLADMIDRRQGWGLTDESHRVLAGLERFGCDTWMLLGDQDMATHIFRTQQRRQGVRPSIIAKRIAGSLGVEINLLLPTDDTVQTRLRTDQGWLAFQEYFVRERCRPEVHEVRFEGASKARPTPEALAAIERADIVLIAPSNPIVSIAPILAVPGIRQALERTHATRIAISPLIGGRTVKGPADRMLAAMGYPCNSQGIAACYAGLIDGLVIDLSDAADRRSLEAEGLQVLTTGTLMQSGDDKAKVADRMLAFAHACRREEANA